MFRENLLKILDSSSIDYYKLGSYMVRGSENKDIIIELLPSIMGNIYKDKKIYNKGYFISECLVKFIDNDKFKVSFINSISCISNVDSAKVVNYVLFLLRKMDLSNDDIKLVIDNLLKTDINMEYSTIINLYDYVYSRDISLVNYMLNLYIGNGFNINNIIYLISDKGIDVNIIYNNIDVILSNYLNIDLFKLRDMVINNRNIYLLVKDKIDSNSFLCIFKLVRNLFNYSKLNSEEEDKFNNIIDIIYYIMKDLCWNEDVSISDIKYLGSGAFSYVYLIGNKVIKIGHGRETKSFPDNPYINAMLFRREFVINNKLSIYVEVCEKVDTSSKIMEDELYELYKKLRDINLKWLDVDYRNVGRLLKDNEISWKYQLPVNSDRLGLMPFRGGEKLKRGDVVIIDNDMIFDVKDRDIKNFSKGLQREFEERYLHEKKR